MNQSNQSFIQSSSTVIRRLAMEQQDISDAMQAPEDVNRMVSNILKTVLEGQKSDRLLSDLAEKIGNLSEADTCIIVSATDTKLNQVNYWQEEGSGSIESQIRGKLANLPLTDCVLTKVEDLFQQAFATKIWLGITTQSQNQINGLIILLKFNSTQWTDFDRELLIQISDLMAIAISQTQLQQQTRAKSKYHALLGKIGREVSNSPHPNLLFKNCLAQICPTLELDRGTILMLKYQNPLQAKNKRNKSVKGTVEIASQWSVKSDEDRQDKQSFDFSHSDLCQQAWQNAPHHLCFESGTSFPDLNPEHTTPAIQPQGSALLMMPLMGKKSSKKSTAVVWGFLVLQHDSPHYWSSDELDLIDWVSVQIGTAIVHHQTLNQVQSIVEERTAQLKWSFDVQAKLSEKMRHQIDQLQKLNQLKDDFMNSMSHELKTPLTSMKMAIMMLRRAEISDELREKYLDILEQEWNREYNLIKDLLTLQEVESGELTYSPEELNLNHTIDNLARSFQDKLRSNRNINLETKIDESNLKINTDADSLISILNELLLNASKYSADNTTIELTAKSEATLKGKNVEIAIANYGTGITPEELPYIFDKFRRGKGVTDRAVPGTGLGLALVQYFVEHLNGKIDVSSEPLEPDSDIFVTTFVLKLPQFQPVIS